VSDTGKILTVDGKKLFHPCHCGGQSFETRELFNFASCQVVRCQQCGQLRTYPEPSAESLEEVYSQSTEKYSVAVAEDANRQATFSVFFEDILDRLERVRSERGKLLDIGCNLGDLIFAAKRRGWDAEGLDINKPNVEYIRSKGFVAYDDFLENLHLPENSYDAVVANQVLEHVPEPNEFLQSIRAILKPGGLLFIGVPCFLGPIPLRLQRDRWYALIPEEHIWQFDPKALTGLLTKNGFDIARVKRGCSDFAGRLSLNPKSWVRWITYKTVRVLGQGDFVDVIAVNQPKNAVRDATPAVSGENQKNGQ
jgi:2-polyprenyl-3-methyl-5-hydroxy-6-metoxy-1,4-benzoquinol methylase